MIKVLKYRKVYETVNDELLFKVAEEEFLNVPEKYLQFLLGFRSFLFTGKYLKHRKFEVDFKKDKAGFYKILFFKKNCIMLSSDSKLYKSKLEIKSNKLSDYSELIFTQYYIPSNLMGIFYFYVIFCSQWIFFKAIFARIAARFHDKII
ncbi:MAG: hypothetical protein JXR48_12680 [Candidatus Delongbacteria bacterium]|nr:hypothetical protein [Candidatus Delongbacteria bacterium]MBN2835807.1 hypothetical protein [Candidatus Delongbacteria bacterium]